MLGKRSVQRSMFDAEAQYPKALREGSFYAFLAKERGTIFRDEDFADLYDERIGRASVPPSLLATALLLQTYTKVSDQEAEERATFDVRWSVALGLEVAEQAFAKSTLQLFRARLVTNDKAKSIFERSVRLARNRGHLRGRMRLALDTTNVLGRGAVKDTYNLLADGIVVVMRELAGQAGMSVEEWASDQKLEGYVNGSSLKGEANLDWDSAEERGRLLATVVNDADRLLQEVREAREKLVGDGPEDKALCGAAEPLSQVLRQDIERREAGPQLRDGVAKDRMPSVHDPEMRHGHKSANKRFDGHKAQIAVDTESQIITAVDALAGNAPDNEGALALVKASEKNSGLDVAETVADCAFGDGETRAAFAEDQRLLVAKVPAMRNKGRFPKTNFIIDLEVQSCLCPAGQSGVARYHKLDKEKEGPQEKQLRSFQFAAATCAACPLRPQCTTGQGGRSIQVHPREAMIQAARAFQKSPDFHAYKVARQAVEHRLARLVQLGIRQARYVGRPKTLFQLLMAATVANLTRIAGLDAASSGQSGLQTGPSLALIVLWVAAAALLAAPSHRYPRSIPFPNPLGSATPRFLPPAKTAPSWPHF